MNLLYKYVLTQIPKQMEEGREHTNYFKISSVLQKYTVSFLTGKETKKLHVQEIFETELEFKRMF